MPTLAKKTATICWLLFVGCVVVAATSALLMLSGLTSPYIVLQVVSVCTSALWYLYAAGAIASVVATGKPYFLLVYLIGWPFVMYKMYIDYAMSSGIGGVSRKIVLEDRFDAYRKRQQDWMYVVSLGHSLAERMLHEAAGLRIGNLLRWAGAVVMAIAVIVVSLPISLRREGERGIVATFVGGLFQVDPASATTLPGGGRTSFRLDFLNRYQPTAGLSLASWSGLVGAVRTDYPRQGPNIDGWKALPGLTKLAPVVTRPQKALREHSADLGNGLIALPIREGNPSVLAFVEGRWGWVEVDRYGSCAVFLGPDVDGCSRSGISDEQAYKMAEFDPAAVQTGYVPAVAEPTRHRFTR
ncbi:hypothetical protein MBRA_06270 [Methylobacterium brachiatum]|nr:hypothetical protein MBRA_06270 [Methylobacterium brachiatum]